jgi:hypothetical protein
MYRLLAPARGFSGSLRKVVRNALCNRSAVCHSTPAWLPHSPTFCYPFKPRHRPTSAGLFFEIPILISPFRDRFRRWRGLALRWRPYRNSGGPYRCMTPCSLLRTVTIAPFPLSALMPWFDMIKDDRGNAVDAMVPRFLSQSRAGANKITSQRSRSAIFWIDRRLSTPLPPRRLISDPNLIVAPLSAVLP